MSGAPSTAVTRYNGQTFAINSPVDPALRPQSSDEITLGGEYEVLPRATLGVSYVRRMMNDVIEDMSINEATNYFIGNPGRGIGAAFPKAIRDYDAVSVYLTKAFADLWLAQASYTGPTCAATTRASTARTTTSSRPTSPRSSTWSP
ncbi:hypothetical protein ACN28S_53495 [Cystobacter fuscus]